MIKVSELFNVRYGHSLELNRLTPTSKDQGIPFVSRKMGDNGVAAYVEYITNLDPYPAGELTCALSGNGVLSTFIQERPYYTGFHIACLCPLYNLTKSQLLYYCLCISENRYKYSYGRQANRTLSDILVPRLEEIPEWVNLTNINYFENIDKAEENNFIPELFHPQTKWNYFKFSSLFELKKGKRLTTLNMTEGETPFIGAIDNNNGVSAYVGQFPIHEGNTISVNYDGSVAEAFYQPKPFWASDSVNVLYPKFELTPAIAMFLITIIRNEKYRYNYGRKWHLERMRHSQILLPITLNGEPNWEFMEIYIKSLPFSSQLCG